MKIKLIILLIWSASGLMAQKVTFKAVAPKAVEMGETFQVQYQLNANGSQFSSPTFNDFDFLGGPYTSQSSSMQIINGSMTQSVNISYTYQLRAKKTGTFNIPSASIIVDGKRITSNSPSIEVVTGNSRASSSPSTGQTQSYEPQLSSDDVPEGVIFGRTLVNKRNVYVGEPILVTQKIFSEKKIANVSEFKEPAYNGFWKEGIDIGELKLDRESYNNKVYYTVTIQKMIMFPQKAGKLELGSFDMKAVISIVKTRKPRDQWEQWMYGNSVTTAENTNVSVNSPKVSINVKPLPEANKPTSFSGIIGHFDLKASIDKNEIGVNDALTLKVTVSGTGNINLINIPKPEFPSDFEVYDPKTNIQTDNSVAGIKGFKSYEYLIIPRNEGNFIINPIKFNYFDVDKKKYVEIVSDTFKIKVGKGDGKTYIATPQANQKQVKQLSEDIRFIKTNVTNWQTKDYHRFNSLLHIFILILIPIIFILIWLLRKKQIEASKDLAAMRNKKATKVAQKRLKKAKVYLTSQNKKEFYEEISRVLWGYLSDKFNISRASLSMENVKEVLKGKMEQESITEIMEVLNNCEFARFARGSEQVSLTSIYDSTLMIISKIEKSLK